MEMNISDEVNNTNIQFEEEEEEEEEEALNQRLFPKYDMMMKIFAQKSRQLSEQEQRFFEQFVQSDVLPQYYTEKIDVQKYRPLSEQEQWCFEGFGRLNVDHLKILEEKYGHLSPELQPFGTSHDALLQLSQDDMKIKIDAQKYRQRFEPELPWFERFGQSDVQDRRIIREVALGFAEFLTFIVYSVFLIPGHYYRALYILMFCVVRYQAQALITQSAFKLGTQSLLSMGEAFTEFFPQITQMMTIMLCYLLMFWLVCPLDPVIQISIILLLIVAPCYYIPQVLGMASGVDVICGFFKVPLIWFTASVALALALIFVFISLLLIYLIRRFIRPGNLKENQSSFIHPGDPSVEKLIEVSLDALSGENMV